MLKMFFRTRVRWNGHRLRTQSCLVEVCERCFRCAKGCSGVGVVRYLMGELCAQSNMVEVMPHARSSVFLQFKNQHHVWQTNTMDQYVGEWSSCEGFFPPFFVAVVVRGQHNEVPPRGGAGVRRLIFTIIGSSFLFFWSPSLWSPSFWCKTLLINGQKCFNNKNLAAMSSFVVLETNCSQLIIVETLLTICKQCFPQCFPFTLTVWSKKKIHYVLCYKFNVFIHFYCILWL